jgi:hypothetical protein
VKDDFPVDSETLLVTDFVNLKIKSAQSFRSGHRGRMYVRVFIEIIARTCMSICVSQKQGKNGGNNHWKTVNRDLSKGEKRGLQTVGPTGQTYKLHPKGLGGSQPTVK